MRRIRLYFRRRFLRRRVASRMRILRYCWLVRDNPDFRPSMREWCEAGEIKAWDKKRERPR